MASKVSAKKGVKRTGQAAEAPAKKPKQDPSFAGVKEALEMADVPETCKQMLLACFPMALSTPLAERHETQTKMVGMISEVLETIHTKLAEALEVESSKVQNITHCKEELVAVQNKATENLEAKTEDVTSKTTALSDASKALKDAKDALVEKQNIQRTADSDIFEAQDAKTLLVKGLEQDVQPIVAGEAEKLGSHYQALKPLLKHLSLDESLKGVLESASKKKKADRGNFDHMCVEQFTAQVQEKISALTKVIEEAGPEAKERAKAVEDAQIEVERTTAADVAAAEELKQAQDSEKEAKGELTAAKKSLKDYEPEYAEGTKVRDEKAEALDNFKNYNMECFNLLRDRASPVASEGGA